MTAKLKPLAEQVVVVTGASSGIGLLIAQSAAQRGARVFLIARDDTILASIVAGIRAEGGNADHAVADVGDEGAVGAAALRAVERFGRIDCWVNDAGVAIYAKLTDTPDDEHVRLFQTNYFGVVHGCRAAIPHLRDGGGALITIASIAADMPSPILGAYTASKHAVRAYVDSLRIELLAEKAPIAVTLIKPAGIATPIGVHAANHLDGETLVPPPAYDPQLVADAVLYCAEHSRREVTVGGIGRAQSLFAELFPTLFDRIAPVVIPMLKTPKVAKTDGDSLFSPSENGRARSPNEVGIPVSPYTTLALRPRLAATLLVAGFALAAGTAWRLRSSSA